MVPSYTGTSTYLLMTKYNNYAGVGAATASTSSPILDPNATQIDPITGATVMKEVLTIAGPTAASPPAPQRGPEWCINTAAVDPVTEVDPGQQRGRQALPLGPDHQHAHASRSR